MKGLKPELGELTVSVTRQLSGKKYQRIRLKSLNLKETVFLAKSGHKYHVL